MTKRRAWAPVAVACLQLALAGGAWAQYRPPPMSDAARLIADGDELRVAAAKAASFGEKENAEEKLKEAVAAYEKALVADPNAVTAATGLGLACASLKDWDRIITVLTPHQARAPKDIDLAYNLGLALLKKKKYAEAWPLLDLAAAADRPDLFIAHYYLGWLAMQKPDGPKASTELEQYLKQRPKEVAGNDHEIHELLGRAYLLQKNAPKARTSLEAAQAGRPESVGIQMGLVSVLELEGKAPAAVTLMDGLVVRFPKAPEPRERLARAMINAGNIKRAESLTKELLALQNSAPAHLLMADVHLAQKQHAAAERELRASLKLQPNQPLAQINLGNVLQIQGRHDEAIAVLVVAAQSAGSSQAAVWAALGTIQRRAGKHEQAVETHQKLAALELPGPLAYVLLGADHFAASHWDPAIVAYGTALERDPGSAKTKHWLALALNQRAKARTQAGLFDDAIRDLRRANELERTVLIARNLGALLLTQKQFAEAHTVLNDAVTLPGAGWQERYLLSWAMLGTGDLPGATAGFEQAAGMVTEPDLLAQINAGWGLALLEAGDFDAGAKRLSETAGKSKAAADNLSLALIRQALTRLRAGNVAGAQDNLEAVQKAAKVPGLEGVIELMRGLLAIEQRRVDLATAAFKKGLPATDKTPATNATRGFLEAYLEYRRERPAEAKKKLLAARKLAKSNDAWADFFRAASRMEGEAAYSAGAMAQAEKALREAQLSGDPANGYTLHNLACGQYRKGAAGQAVTTWRALVGAVPEATLNLGIVAQVQSKDMRRAATYYGQYLASRGAFTGLAREWRDRIEAIYGVTGEAVEEPKQ